MDDEHPAINAHPGTRKSQLQAVLRRNHSSRRMEKTYWYWVVAYIRFHQHKHPLQLAEQDVSLFLSHLARNQYGTRANLSATMPPKGHYSDSIHEEIHACPGFLPARLSAWVRSYCK